MATSSRSSAAAEAKEFYTAIFGDAQQKQKRIEHNYAQLVSALDALNTPAERILAAVDALKKDGVGVRSLTTHTRLSGSLVSALRKEYGVSNTEPEEDTSSSSLDSDQL